MIPFKPSSEKTLAHQLLTFVKLNSVLKGEQDRLLQLKNSRPKVQADFIKWNELNNALEHEAEIARTEHRIVKLHHKTEEYEKELIQYIPSYLYQKTIEINLLDDENRQRFCFLVKVISKHEISVIVK